MAYQNTFGTKVYEWPYPVAYDRVNHVDLDVLVVGGGLAGCMAGIAAARKGAKVGVADKSTIKRSGCGGAGMDHWNNVLEYEGAPMTVEENLEKGSTAGRQGNRDYIALKGTWDALMVLEQLGLPIRDEDGDFEGASTLDKERNLLKAYDYRELVAVKLRGGQYIKPVLYRGLRNEENVQLFERVMVTRVLTEGGKRGAPICGATGFSLETGEFYVFHCKTVINTCGYACTLWTYSTEITGNSYRWDPNEIGEGLAMSWLAGADIFGMYKNGHTRAAHPMAWPRFGVGNPTNTWFPCTMVDNNGKELPWVDGDGNPITTQEARNMPTDRQIYCGSVISDVYKDIKCPSLDPKVPEMIKKGELVEPIWADLPSMYEAERRSIWGMMIGNEGKSRYNLFDNYTRMGFNPDTDMLMCPIQQDANGYLSGGVFQGEGNYMKAWRSESFGNQGEPMVDWNLMTTVPGLYAGGAASGLEGCSYACSSGWYAGERAAEYCEKHSLADIDKQQLQAEIDRVYAPVKRAEEGDLSNYISWKELWGGSARVMQQCCGDNLTVPIIDLGLTWLDSIKKNEMQHTYARNPHELARVMEDETRITVSEMFLNACREKVKWDAAEKEKKAKEAALHPEKKAEGKPKGGQSGTVTWGGKNPYIIQHLDEAGKVVTHDLEDNYWLKAPYAPTYLENYEAATGRKEA